MKLIVRYLRPFFGRMGLGLSIKLVGSVMDLFIPYILAYVIDEITPRGSISAVYIWGLIMLACAIAAVVGNIIANRMASSVARDFTRTLRHDLFARIARLGGPELDDLTVPSLISRMTTDTYNLHRMVAMMQRLGVRAPLLVLGGIAITMTLDPVLSAILVAMLPVMCVVVLYISKKSVPLFAKLQLKVDELVRVVRENASGVRVIKALSLTQDEKKRFEGVNGDVMRAENKANMTMASSPPVMNFLMNFGLVLVVVVGAWRVNGGRAGVGVITAFLTYFTIILNAMLSITRVLTEYSKSLASAERIEKVLNTESREGKMLKATEEPSASPEHIEFERVGFSYGQGSRCLEDVSFSVAKGASIGIIGPTGAGKSTVASLLLRFYDAQEGRVLIDGLDIRTLEPETLRRRFGVVFQNDLLFRKTIRENIDMGRGLPEEQILLAVRAAQAESFIREAGGMDTMLEARGTNLSGGQKQRLLVARALAGKPEFLILDDSSSALDFRTDAAMRAAIKEDYGGTTTIIVAQRVSSVMNCDAVLALDDGRVRGFGAHTELLRSCALYREIYELQTGRSAKEVTA